MAQTTASLPQGLFFDFLRQDEVDDAYALEVQGFPPDEAATREKLGYRQKEAAHLFLGAYIPPRQLIGFATSTASASLDADSMSVHSSAPDANLVCLHSACVSPDYQRRGIASALLREYIARLTRAETGDARRGYKDVALLAHDRLRPLYEKAGFKVMGQSDVQWGSEPWLEMRCPIQPSSSSTAGSKSALSSQAEPFMPSQAAILAALQAQSAQSSSGARNPGQAYEQVASAANTEEELEKRLVNPADGTNKADLFCPRQQCRCMLLRKGAATWVKRAPGPIADPRLSLPNSPPPPSTTSASASASASASGTSGFWLVSSPLSFENVGFSKDAPWSSSSTDTNATITEKVDEKVEASDSSASAPAIPVKYLLCADCDCGPLGYHLLPHGMVAGGLADAVGREVAAQQGGGGGGEAKKTLEFSIAAERVRYRFREEA